MLVGVCDFPGSYRFPPAGYGGIERWLWAVALGARRAAADVHLLGPQWRPELVEDWTLRPVRLEDLTTGDREFINLRHAGYDLFVVGHEYASLPTWRSVWEELNADLATFQHWPKFQHRPDAFDGERSRLYCYSDEMCSRYADHQPAQALAVHSGLGEQEPLAPHEDGDLVWLGRIDADKAPHLAVSAAARLGRSITLAGPVFDTVYVERYQDLLAAPHVHMAGEVDGAAKAELLAAAGVLVYTCAREYIEAGAAVFGEALRAGTAVAALSWRPGTCAHAALCDRTGSVALADPHDEDEIAASSLAASIEHASALCGKDVQEVGMDRFDTLRHFRTLAALPC